jgi:hypothetical protein
MPHFMLYTLVQRRCSTRALGPSPPTKFPTWKQAALTIYFHKPRYGTIEARAYLALIRSMFALKLHGWPLTRVKSQKPEENW